MQAGCVQFFHIFCRLCQRKEMAFADEEDQFLFRHRYIVVSGRHFLTAEILRPGGGHAEHVLRQVRSEEHTSELQSRFDLVCRLLLEKKKKKQTSGSVTSVTITVKCISKR